MIKVNTNVRPLLQHAVNAELARYYEDDASPEASPESSPIIEPAPDTFTVQEASALNLDPSSLTSDPPSTPTIVPNAPSHSVSRKAKKLLRKRLKERAAQQALGPMDPVKTRRKIRSSTSKAYAKPHTVSTGFSGKTMSMTRFADTGICRPAGKSVPSLPQLQRQQPNLKLVEVREE